MKDARRLPREDAKSTKTAPGCRHLPLRTSQFPHPAPSSPLPGPWRIPHSRVAFLSSSKVCPKSVQGRRKVRSRFVQGKKTPEKQGNSARVEAKEKNLPTP